MLVPYAALLLLASFLAVARGQDNGTTPFDTTITLDPDTSEQIVVTPDKLDFIDELATGACVINSTAPTLTLGVGVAKSLQCDPVTTNTCVYPQESEKNPNAPPARIFSTTRCKPPQGSKGPGGWTWNALTVCNTRNKNGCNDPDNWYFDCGICNAFCPADNGLPFGYTFPSISLSYYRAPFGGTKRGCAVENQNKITGPQGRGTDFDDTLSGIFCCNQCFLYRTLRQCPGYDPSGSKCWAGKPVIAGFTQDARELVIKETETITQSSKLQHWLMLPTDPVTGIEDDNTDGNNRALWQSAYLYAINIVTFPDAPVTGGGKQSFPTNVIPANSPERVGIGVNMANARSQHQLHIHYAFIPRTLRDALRDDGNWPSTSTLSPASCRQIAVTTTGSAKKTIQFGAYFFKGQKIIQATWTPRQLASLCQPEWRQVLPQQGLGQFSAEDLAMAQSSMMIVPFEDVGAGGFVDPLASYYVLFGNFFDPTVPSGQKPKLADPGFRAEGMMCTSQGLDNNWSVSDCTGGLKAGVPPIVGRPPVQNPSPTDVCQAVVSGAPGCSSRRKHKRGQRVCTSVAITTYYETPFCAVTPPEPPITASNPGLVVRICLTVNFKEEISKGSSKGMLSPCSGVQAQNSAGVLTAAFWSDTATVFGVPPSALLISGPVNVQASCPAASPFEGPENRQCAGVSPPPGAWDAGVVFNPTTTAFGVNDRFLGCFEVRGAQQFTPPAKGFPFSLVYQNVTSAWSHLSTSTVPEVCMAESICASP